MKISVLSLQWQFCPSVRLIQVCKSAAVLKIIVQYHRNLCLCAGDIESILTE